VFQSSPGPKAECDGRRAVRLIALAVERDRVREILVIGNPDKLRGV
jgi:hypothetical protein